MDPGEWIHAPRLPLIDLYRGRCRAGDPVELEEAVQREICNWGCARGKCGRVPAEGPDAVRFSMIDGRVVYVFEQECAPVEHGVADGNEPEVLRAQIGAFEASWRDHFQSSRGGENVSIATASSSVSAE